MAIHNLSGVDEPQGKDILEPGTYPVRVVGCEAKWANSGKKYWLIRMVVTEGTRAKCRVEDTLFFTEKSLPRLKYVLDRFGVTEFGPAMDSVDDDYPEILIGREAWVTLLIEEYIDNSNEKRQRNKVDFRGYSPRIDPTEPFILIAKRAPADTGGAGEQQGTLPENSQEVPF